MNNVNGDISGKFDLIYFSPNTASIPISGFDDYIYNVSLVDLNLNVLLTYRPSNTTNPFTYFESENYYLIFSKKNFAINIAEHNPDKIIISGNIQGKYSYFKYPFNSLVALSSFGSKISNLQETSLNGGTITTYEANRAFNPVKTFKKNRIYLIKSAENFIIYNRDILALKQEQSVNEENWILTENGIDRILLG